MARTAQGQITYFDVSDGASVASPVIYKRAATIAANDRPDVAARYTVCLLYTSPSPRDS